MRRRLDFFSKNKLLTASIVLVYLIGLVRYLWKMGDFEVYFAAGYRFLFGASIHIPEANMFTYPTVAALPFAPLTQLGHTVAKSAFFTASFVLLIVGIWLTNRYVFNDNKQSLRTRRIVFFTAFLFSLRYILAAFDNQQTDLMIFGLITIGIHLYQSTNRGAAIAWSLAAALKANPMFMILLPLFQHRWRVMISMFVLVFIFALLPDVLKYLVEPNVNVTSLTLPANVIPRNGTIQSKVFALFPIADTPTAYLREYAALNFNITGGSWWENVSNPANQSLTRIILYLSPLDLNGTYVFASLCSLFAIALFFLSVRASTDNLFITGVLFYAAFILIGPHSSKPHFIVIYGLLLYCFHNLSQRFSITRLCFLLTIGVMLGFTSSGFIAKHANQLATAGHIGITAFLLWLYTYVLALSECKENNKRLSLDEDLRPL